MLTQTIGFIGTGQMARALAKGFIAAGLVPANRIIAFDAIEKAGREFGELVGGAKVAASNAEVVRAADVIFLAVKPQSMPAVYAEIGGQVAADKLIVSIAAGISLAKLREGLKTERLVRVMPNTPALVGQGASAYALGSGVADNDSLTVGMLLDSVGTAFLVEEKQLDAVTGLSGSGPAFVYVMIEALSDGGVKVGLPRSLATKLAAQTVLGAAQMVLATDTHPAVLKDNVASPGGTTIAGLAALEDRGLRGALIAAVEAATRRSQELGVG